MKKDILSQYTYLHHEVSLKWRAFSAKTSQDRRTGQKGHTIRSGGKHTLRSQVVFCCDSYQRESSHSTNVDLVPHLECLRSGELCGLGGSAKVGCVSEPGTTRLTRCITMTGSGLGKAGRR